MGEWTGDGSACAIEAMPCTPYSWCAMTHRYVHAGAVESMSYLWPAVRSIVGEREWTDKRAFDVGCGNGWVCNELSGLGFAASGIDVSETGVAQAKRAFPHLTIDLGSVYDADLAEKFGTFPLVLCLEVIEHCYNPRRAMKAVLSLLGERGIAIVSTPFHGFFKNLALAASGRMDDHFAALKVGGHIKFFSKETLSRLVHESGGTVDHWIMAGRVYPFSKSMVAVIRRS